MSVILVIVGTVLLLFELLLVARAVLDWSAALAGPPVPGSVRSRLSATARALTEPVLAPVRRVLPPLRLGQVSLDTSFIAVFVAILLLRQLIVML
ncbi:MAG TPA: YggT family protein [Rugosimonospora sp.]|nr:YggT family protein [Rugosimonospora sp.]